MKSLYLSWSFEPCGKRFSPNPFPSIIPLGPQMFIDAYYSMLNVGALTLSPSEALHSWKFTAL